MDLFNCPEEDELFGSTRPENLPPIVDKVRVGDAFLAARQARESGIQLIERGDPEDGGNAETVSRSSAAKKRKTQERYLHKLTREYYDKLGFFGWRCDRTEVTPYQTITRDLMGIADRFALKREETGLRIVLVQITVKEQVGAHVQKIANPKNVVEFEDRKDVAIRELAEMWFSLGGEIEIIGWEKLGRNWVPVITRVTPDLLSEADKRRRK